MRVISQHNLWFRGRPRFTNYKLNGKSMLSVTPLLGLRDSSDPEALEQEMQWLHRYTGRDGSNFIYSLEWIKPGDIIDRNLNEVFLPAIERTEAQWNLFYDPVLAVKQRDIPSGTPIDFSRPEVADMFRADLSYFWANYFNHPGYWHLRRKPVLYIWSITNGMVNAGSVLREAQTQGVYVLGDVFGGPEELPPLDGVTGFVASTPEVQGQFTDIQTVLPLFEDYYRRYQEPGSGHEGDVIPALSLQYDDTQFRSLIGGIQTRVLASGRPDVVEFLTLAKDHAPKIRGQKYVFLGTTNNWPEATTLLPTKSKGAAYMDSSTGLTRVGNYGFEHLEVMREVLFPEVPEYRGPRIERMPNGSVRFFDCDVKGTLTTKGKAGNLPVWETLENLRRSVNGERVWKPKITRKVTLRFENLDGLKTKLKVRP